MACIFHEMPYVFECMNIQSFYAACRYVYTHKIYELTGCVTSFICCPQTRMKKMRTFAHNAKSDK